MVVNLRLSKRTEMGDEFDSLGRDWYGYDPLVRPEVLWIHNRGRWNISEARLAGETLATFSFEGFIVLVARLMDHELVADSREGVMKVALIGSPVNSGDAYAALIGQRVPWGRNPVVYMEDPPDLPPVDSQPVIPIISGEGQGWQQDPARRKKVEDAAQDRLMSYFTERGWAVIDTRYGSSFDAVAEKGEEVRYLEAKGTETAGVKVIVTPGEVEHARRNRGKCVMGIWSDIVFGADQEVDPLEGNFRVMEFDPDEGVLAPTGYEWCPVAG